MTSQPCGGLRSNAWSTPRCAWPPPASNIRFVIAAGSLGAQRDVAEERERTRTRVVAVGGDADRCDPRKRPVGGFVRERDGKVPTQIATLFLPRLRQAALEHQLHDACAVRVRQPG